MAVRTRGSRGLKQGRGSPMKKNIPLAKLKKAARRKGKAQLRVKFVQTMRKSRKK